MSTKEIGAWLSGASPWTVGLLAGLNPALLGLAALMLLDAAGAHLQGKWDKKLKRQKAMMVLVVAAAEVIGRLIGQPLGGGFAMFFCWVEGSSLMKRAKVEEVELPDGWEDKVRPLNPAPAREKKGGDK